MIYKKFPTSVGNFFYSCIFCLWTYNTKYSIITSLFLLNMESFFEKVLLFVGKTSDIGYVDRCLPVGYIQMKGLCHDTRRRTQRVRGRET